MWSSDSIASRKLTSRPRACEMPLCGLASPLVASFISTDFMRALGVPRKPGQWKLP